jgi:hypothetical protein
LFFHRDIEELKKNEEEQAAKIDEPAAAPVYDDVVPDMAGGDMAYGGQPLGGAEWDAAGDTGAVEQW